MKCTNHPVSPAIGECASCDQALCGVCARFIDDQIFCEKCAEHRQAAALVKERNEMLDRDKEKAGLTITDPKEAARTETEDKHKRNWQLGIIAACVVILIAQFALTLSGQRRMESSVDAQGLSPLALPQCLIVFQQIGQVLARGQEPDPALRCEPTAIPNVVTRNGASVRVAHPNPALFGYSAIYVSSEQPLPQLVEAPQN